MERIRIIKFILVIIILQLNFSCQNLLKKKKKENYFEGTWTATLDNDNLDIHNLYIKKENENIYNCYFIASNGSELEYKAIFEDNVLKIGNDYTIKYLVESKQIYIVERSLPFKRTKDFAETLVQIRKNIVQSGNHGIHRYMFFPFKDELARDNNPYSSYDDRIYDYSMNQAVQNMEKIEFLFSARNLDCLLTSEVVSYTDLENDEGVMMTTGNFLRPYEFYISCYDPSNRDFKFLFSLSEGEYKICKLLYYP